MAGKTVQPPPLPQDILQRVIRVAGTHGRMIMTVAGVFCFLTALGRQAAPTLAGVIAVGMGAFEMHGAFRLREGSPRGLNWMVAGQFGLMAVVLAYCGWMATHFDAAAFEHQLPDWYLNSMTEKLSAAGLREQEFPVFWASVNRLTYSILAAVTVAYQGGLVGYYLRSRKAVIVALASLAR